jgi:hypothetical protein
MYYLLVHKIYWVFKKLLFVQPSYLFHCKMPRTEAKTRTNGSDSISVALTNLRNLRTSSSLVFICSYHPTEDESETKASEWLSISAAT